MADNQGWKRVSLFDAEGLRVLVEGCSDGFFVHDVTGRIVDVNARSCVDLGYSREELLNLNINDISGGPTPEENARNWEHATPGIALSFQEVAIRKDGSTFPAEISIACQIIKGQKLFLGFARDISEREAARRKIEAMNDQLERRIEARTAELREARERLQAVMDGADDVIFLKDREGYYRVLNHAAERLTGVREADALGRKVTDLLPDARGDVIRAEEEKVFATGVPSTIEEVLPFDGRERVFQTRRSVHRDPGGSIVGLVTIARDITDLKRGERRIREEHDRLLLAARVGRLGVWEHNLRHDVLLCDEQWYRIMGRDPLRPIRSIAEFRAFIHPDDVERATTVDAQAEELEVRREDYGIAFRIIRPDGEVRWVRSVARISEAEDGTPERATGFVVDITERHLAEEKLERQVLEDPLTGIANRRRLDREMERACLHASRTGEPLSIAMIDVDFFKPYNDHYGHAQGDATLRAVAGVLANAVRRPHDLAARYGGEEFMLLLPGSEDPEAVFSRLSGELAALALPHATSPIAACVTVSAGCVVVSKPVAVCPRELLALSDEALYRAKAGGRNRAVVVQT